MFSKIQICYFQKNEPNEEITQGLIEIGIALKDYEETFHKESDVR